MSHFLGEHELLFVTDRLNALLDGRNLTVPRIRLIFSPIFRLSNKYELVIVLFLKALNDTYEVIEDSDLFLHCVLLLLLEDGIKCIAHHCDQHIENSDLGEERGSDEDEPDNLAVRCPIGREVVAAEFSER
jgi:hypothetical protein